MKTIHRCANYKEFLKDFHENHACSSKPKKFRSVDIDNPHFVTIECLECGEFWKYPVRGEKVKWWSPIYVPINWQILPTKMEKVRAFPLPIPRYDFAALGKKLLAVEELPQGALAQYERDMRNTSKVITKYEKDPRSTCRVVNRGDFPTSSLS